MLFEEDNLNIQVKKELRQKRLKELASIKLPVELLGNRKTRRRQEASHSKGAKGRRKRHDRQVRKLRSEALDCPFPNPIWHRVEMVWENKLCEQGYFELHWIAVKHFTKKNRDKYKKLSAYDPNTSLELQYLTAYLTLYYQHNFPRENGKTINKVFIYEARKLDDKNIHAPALTFEFDRDTFVSVGAPNKHELAAYRATIFHKRQIS